MRSLGTSSNLTFFFKMSWTSTTSCNHLDLQQKFLLVRGRRVDMALFECNCPNRAMAANVVLTSKNMFEGNGVVSTSILFNGCCSCGVWMFLVNPFRILRFQKQQLFVCFVNDLLIPNKTYLKTHSTGLVLSGYFWPLFFFPDFILGNCKFDSTWNILNRKNDLTFVRRGHGNGPKLP